MNTAVIVAALDIPAPARVDQRVPKKLLVENGAPTTTDKRRINEGIEELRWVAVLKPTTIGIPAFSDDTREYLEIAVLSAALRPDAQEARLAELIHRAVPYPVFLIAEQDGNLSLSVAHKRWSQGEAGKTILDEAPIVVDLGEGSKAEHERPFLESLSLSRQPRATLFELYQGWVDKLIALQAARLTGTFRPGNSYKDFDARREALRDFERLEAEIKTLRSAAAKEKQLPRQVEINLQLQRARNAQVAAKERLSR